MKILCIIPIYNEESRLKSLIEKILQFKKVDLRKIDFMMINNGSNDGTKKLLKDLGLNFINAIDEISINIPNIAKIKKISKIFFFISLN